MFSASHGVLTFILMFVLLFPLTVSVSLYKKAGEAKSRGSRSSEALTFRSYQGLNTQVLR